MAYFSLYLVYDDFQALSSQGRDLLDEAKAADTEIKKIEKAVQLAKDAGRAEEAAAKLAEADPFRKIAAAKRAEASVIENKIGLILEENAEKAVHDSVRGKLPDTSNPFPDWVREIIKEFGKAKFDTMNAEYKVRTPATDEEEAEIEYAAFKAKLDAAIKADPEKDKWSTTHHIQCRISFDDEVAAMAELEKYYGTNPSDAYKKAGRKE